MGRLSWQLVMGLLPFVASQRTNQCKSILWFHPGQVNIIFFCSLCLWGLIFLRSLLLFTQPRAFLSSLASQSLILTHGHEFQWLGEGGGGQITLLKPLFLYMAGTWSMKNISCSSYSFNLRGWSLVIWFVSNSCTHLPLLAFSFYCCCCCFLSLSPNFPRKTPPRYMPCLAARLLNGFRPWALRNSASYTNIGHFITCFHQLGPLLMKNKTKTRPRTFPRLPFVCSSDNLWK